MDPRCPSNTLLGLALLVDRHHAGLGLAHRLQAHGMRDALGSAVPDPSACALAAMAAMARRALEATDLWRVVSLLLLCMIVAHRPGGLAQPLAEALHANNMQQSATAASATLQALKRELRLLPANASVAFLIAFTCSLLARPMPALPSSRHGSAAATRLGHFHAAADWHVTSRSPSDVEARFQNLLEGREEAHEAYTPLT
jgi:hypothetical protein